MTLRDKPIEKPIEPVIIEASPDDVEALGQVMWQEQLNAVGYTPDNEQAKTFIQPAKVETLQKMSIVRANMAAGTATLNVTWIRT